MSDAIPLHSCHQIVRHSWSVADGSSTSAMPVAHQYPQMRCPKRILHIGFLRLATTPRQIAMQCDSRKTAEALSRIHFHIHLIGGVTLSTLTRIVGKCLIPTVDLSVNGVHVRCWTSRDFTGRPFSKTKTCTRYFRRHSVVVFSRVIKGLPTQ
jgi:hypothetical protein